MKRSLFTVIMMILVNTVLIQFQTVDTAIAQSAQECYEEGLKLKEAGDIDGAIKMFDKARKKDRDHAEANFQLAVCYITQQTVTGRIYARYALDRALKTDRENTKYLRLYADLESRWSFSIPQAMQIFEEILAIDSTDVEAMQRLVELDEIRYGEYKEKLEGDSTLSDDRLSNTSLRKTNIFRPINALIPDELPKEQNELEQDEDYRTIFSAPEGGSADPAVLTERGYKLMEYDYIDSAEAVFKHVIKLDATLPRSFNGLGLVYFHKGRKAIHLFDTISELLDTDNYQRAVREFERALELDTEYEEAQFNLAKTYCAKGGENDLKIAAVLLLQLLGSNPDYPYARLYLGKIYHDMGNFFRAEEYLLKQLEETPDCASAKVYLGKTTFYLGDEENATSYYLDGLDETVIPEILEDSYADLQWILTDSEKKQYEGLTDLEKGAFIAGYWNRNDPNVMTSVNELLIEHFRRVDHAQKYFYEKNYNGYDDRGQVYIRFGEPDKKQVSVGGPAAIAEAGFLKSSESWLYDTIDHNLAFDFVSLRGEQYRIVPDLSHASTPRNNNVARELYIERIGLGGIYTVIGGKASNSRDFMNDLVFEYITPVTKAFAEAPVLNFKIEFEESPLDFPFGFAQFRGRNGMTDLELYIGIPHEDIEFAEGINGFAADVETELTIIDSDFNRPVTRTRNLRIRTLQVSPDNHTLSLESLEMKPGDYKFGIQAIQINANKRGIYQPDLNVRDFSGTDLMVSDIRICSESDIEIQPVITSRDQLTLKPYPFSFVKKSQPLAMYFEIYNLSTAADGTSSYSMTYTITPAAIDAPPLEKALTNLGRFLTGKRSGSVAITEERTSGNTSVYEMVVIDISDLPEMDMVITITVEDNQSNKTAVSNIPVKVIQ
ncbi:tetratricopeptide repeat protein [candidate division KSB1 bacterium]